MCHIHIWTDLITYFIISVFCPYNIETHAHYTQNHKSCPINITNILGQFRFSVRRITEITRAPDELWTRGHCTSFSLNYEHNMSLAQRHLAKSSRQSNKLVSENITSVNVVIRKWGLTFKQQSIPNKWTSGGKLNRINQTTYCYLVFHFDIACVHYLDHD